MTRDEAKAIAVKAAYHHGYHHGYMPPNPNDFEPHEWVIEAILDAVAEAGLNTARSTFKGPPYL